MKDHRDLIMPAGQYGPQSMDLNPITLSFPNGLEKAFKEHFFSNSLTLVRISLLAGIFFYGFFGILDAHLVPEMKNKLWYVRFVFVSPFLLAVIGFSYFKQFKKYFQISVASAMIISGLGIIFMISLVPPPVNYSYYAGLILVFIWGYAFTRVRFIYATPAGWLLVLLYEIVAVHVSNTPTSVLYSNNFFFIGANIIGMFVCYSIEYYARANFYITYLLEKEQEKIIAANRRLEELVDKRTKQLLGLNKDLVREIEERKRSEEKIGGLGPDFCNN